VFQLDKNLSSAYFNLIMPMSQQSNCRNFSHRPTPRQRLTAGFIFLAIIAVYAFLFAAANDKINIHRFIDPCGFKLKFGLPCLTCGMTTAILAFVRGRIFESFYIQPAAALLCCLLTAIAVVSFLVAVFGIDYGFVARLVERWRPKYILLAVLIILLAAWAVTLSRAITAK